MIIISKVMTNNVFFPLFGDPDHQQIFTKLVENFGTIASVLWTLEATEKTNGTDKHA
jgi:hypothetical protein